MHSYTTGSEHKTILHCLEQYRLSIEGADNPALAEAVWATTPEVTMIHPLGHELGWEAIRSNFYEKTMAAYKVAVAEKYRFFSFGDAMLIL